MSEMAKAGETEEIDETDETGETNETDAMNELDPQALIEARDFEGGSPDDVESQMPQLFAAVPARGVLEVAFSFDPEPGLRSAQECGPHAVVAVQARGRWVLELRHPEAPAVMDLRDCEPPLPLERILEASARLAPGEAVFARTPRIPRMLFPQLERRGLAWHVIREPDESALVCVQRPR